MVVDIVVVREEDLDVSGEQSGPKIESPSEKRE